MSSQTRVRSAAGPVVSATLEADRAADPAALWLRASGSGNAAESRSGSGLGPAGAVVTGSSWAPQVPGGARSSDLEAVARVLELLQSAALLVGGDGTLVYSNLVARAALPAAPEWLPAIVRGEPSVGRLASVSALRLGSETLFLVLPAPAHAAEDPISPDGLAGRLGIPPRHARIASLVVAGFSDKQIAERTGLTTPTVRTYVKHVYKRLGVHSRIELMRLVGT